MMPCELQYMEYPAANDACDNEGHIEVWTSSSPQEKGMQYVSAMHISFIALKFIARGLSG